MKLNNKGFAFSTLLYGLLAVIIVLMAILLGMYRKTNNESYYYASVLEESLNKCVDQEIALENCYRGTNPSSCSNQLYYSCLGYDDMLVTAKKINLNSYLETLVANSSTTNFYDIGDGQSLKYAYRGEDVKNYVKFSGKSWRIVGITSTGEIKLVLPNGIEGLFEWDARGKPEWSTSTANNYLNNDFYDTLSDTNLIYKYNWNIGRLDRASFANIKKKELKGIETNATFSSKVGLLSPSDLAYTALPSNCADTSKISTEGCGGSWLKGTKTWLIDSAKDCQHTAYYYNGTKITYDPGTDTCTNETLTVTDNGIKAKHELAPVVYLASDTQMLEGLGSGDMGNPYIIEG